MISVTGDEHNKILEKFHRKSLPQTGRGKKSKRKSYWVLESDKAVVRFLAELRGVSVKKLIGGTPNS